MIGEIKEVEIGGKKVYTYDEKGNILKSVEPTIVPGKKFELRRQGTNTCIEINSIFMDLVFRARRMVDNPTGAQLGSAMAAGMRGEIVIDVQRMIKTCVGVPKITEEKYNELTPDNVMDLFSEIYHFHISEVEKKSDSSEQPETGPTGEKKSES